MPRANALTFSTEGTRLICRVPSRWLSEGLSLFNLSTSVGFGYGDEAPIWRPREYVISWRCCTISSLYSQGRHINIFSFPSTEALAFCFRGRLTQRRFPERWNPWIFGHHDFHMIYRYSCQHSHFQYLQYIFQYIFTNIWNVPLPKKHRFFFVVSVNTFSLDTSSVQISIDQWSITISSKDGCFQANFLVVKAYSLPFPLR